MQKTNLKCKIWLIKYNTSAYDKSTKIYVNIIKEKDIKKIYWPTSSPDLYLIKDIWD